MTAYDFTPYYLKKEDYEKLSSKTQHILYQLSLYHYFIYEIENMEDFLNNMFNYNANNNDEIQPNQSKYNIINRNIYIINMIVVNYIKILNLLDQKNIISYFNKNGEKIKENKENFDIFLCNFIKQKLNLNIKNEKDNQILLTKSKEIKELLTSNDVIKTSILIQNKLINFEISSSEVEQKYKEEYNNYQEKIKKYEESNEYFDKWRNQKVCHLEENRKNLDEKYKLKLTIFPLPYLKCNNSSIQISVMHNIQPHLDNENDINKLKSCIELTKNYILYKFENLQLEIEKNLSEYEKKIFLDNYNKDYRLYKSNSAYKSFIMSTNFRF